MVKKITLKDLVGLIYSCLSFFWAVVLKKYIGEVSIVTERENEARDNGYWFFKYAVEEKEDNRIYYAINKQSEDYKKIKEFSDNVLEFGSFKHCVYTWISSRYISSQYSNGMPNRVMYYLWMKGICKTKFCFLQHGVTQNRSEYLAKPASRVEYISCVSKTEAKFMESLGYCRESIFTNGFCRYDALKKNLKRNKQILIMFTWRKYLEKCSVVEFQNSTYFKEIVGLLRKLEREKLFVEYQFLLCLHPGVEKYYKLFNVQGKNIRVLDKCEIEFNKIINESAMLITDYSSVAFDFAYLEKPVVYFQFDLKEFREKHLQKGYFDYVKDGFGPVYSNSQEIVNCLMNREYENCEEYKKRAEIFFSHQDFKNCERNYNQIMEV